MCSIVADGHVSILERKSCGKLQELRAIVFYVIIVDNTKLFPRNFDSGENGAEKRVIAQHEDDLVVISMAGRHTKDTFVVRLRPIASFYFFFQNYINCSNKFIEWKLYILLGLGILHLLMYYSKGEQTCVGIKQRLHLPQYV